MQAMATSTAPLITQQQGCRSKHVIFKRYHAKLCDLLCTSDDHLISFAASLYSEDIVDSMTKTHVTNEKGNQGADVLIYRVTLQLEQDPGKFEMVLKIMKEKEIFKYIAPKMEAEASAMDSSDEEEESYSLLPARSNSSIVEDKVASDAKTLQDEKFKDLLQNISDCLTDVNPKRLKFLLNFHLTSKQENSSEVKKLLSEIDLIEDPCNILNHLIRNNLIGYLNYRLVKVFQDLIKTSPINFKIEQYETDVISFLKSTDLATLSKVFKRNPGLGPREFIGLPQFIVYLQSSWEGKSMYQWDQLLKKHFNWPHHIHITRIEKNCITIVYSVLPFFVPAVVRDLSNPDVLDLLKRHGVTNVELSDMLKRMRKESNEVSTKSVSTLHNSSEPTSSFSYPVGLEESEFDEYRSYSVILKFLSTSTSPEAASTTVVAGYETKAVYDVNDFETQAREKRNVGIPVFKSLWTFTGLENSSASMVINKAFDFIEAGKKAANNSFLHYEMMACKSETTPELIVTSRSGRNLKNFEIALLKALNLAGIQLSINEDNHDDKAISRNLVSSLQTISETPENSKMLQSFASGIGLINIWEMGFNRSVTPFIESFNGCLTSNSVFLFVDINDVQKLYAPPLSGNRRLKWRSTLQYLIRPCQLSLGSKKNICTVFLMYDSSSQPDHDEVKNCVETLKEYCTLALEQMGIHDNVVCEIIDIDRQSNCKKVAERTRIVLEEAEMDNIDFSHLFLRCILAHMPKICITHEELREKAKQFIEMNENDIKKFCKFFTSFGSILDVKQVNSESNYIIIKPLEFLLKLDYLLTQKRVQESNAAEIAVSDSFNAEHVIRVLIDVHIAMEIPKLPHLQQALQSKYYFTPSVKFGEDQKFKTRFSEGAIQFVMNPGAPRLNINMDIIKRLLKQLQKPSLEFISDDISTIIINTQVGHDQYDFIAISLSYMGDVIEISLEVHGKVTTQQIESTCADIMSSFNESLRLQKKRLNNEKSIKYHFAVLCKKDEFGEGVLYSMYRIRHILPADMCQKCSEAYKERLPIIDLWRRLLKGTNKIDPELILNGDLTIDNICMLAKQLSDFPWPAVIVLANQLNAVILQKDPGINRREWVILQMLIQWENYNYGRESDSLRKIMALKLHDAKKQWKDENERKEENDPGFKQLARKLDIHILTQKQRQKVLKMITKHVDEQAMK